MKYLKLFDSFNAYYYREIPLSEWQLIKDGLKKMPFTKDLFENIKQYVLSRKKDVKWKKIHINNIKDGRLIIDNDNKKWPVEPFTLVTITQYDEYYYIHEDFITTENCRFFICDQLDGLKNCLRREIL